ncbi:MAG: 50S ribosomal protein L15e [Candidatus Brockarchaeota archaeon]|nr:50S ribosomal protein L15e [Candidatus Brockarchaeota archaeon]
MRLPDLSESSLAKLDEAREKVRIGRLIAWRKQRSAVRVERPTNASAARRLGYKAKQGFVVVRVRVARGGRRKPRPRSGRRQKHLGVVLFTPSKSRRLIAEERAARKYPNLEVLGSYCAGEDGTSKWFEVIMADPDNPRIKADPSLEWLSKRA